MLVKRFGVSLEESTLRRLDNLVEEKQFPNRSRAIRFLIEKIVVEQKWEDNKDSPKTLQDLGFQGVPSL